MEADQSVGIIALTMFNDEDLILDMIRAGAKGYLLKSTTKEELIKAITTVHKGFFYHSPETTVRLSKLIAGIDTPEHLRSSIIDLTEKELLIIDLICREYSSKQIAPMVHLSARTVENYRNRIAEKMGVQNTAGIVVYAIKHGIFKP